MARVAGLMFLIAFGLNDCFWLALLIAFSENTVNQRQHFRPFGGGDLRNMLYQLLAQIGAGRVAMVMRACFI